MRIAFVHENWESGAMRCVRDLRVVSPGEWLRRRLATTELGRFETRAILHGVDVDRLRPIPQAEARSRLGLPQGVPLVLHWPPSKARAGTAIARACCNCTTPSSGNGRDLKVAESFHGSAYGTDKEPFAGALMPGQGR